MTSVLRLGSKDRSSFPFFKRQTTVLEISTDSLAHRLPHISPLNTRSFAGLFDDFLSNENHDLPPAKRPHQPKVSINRNDSAASSCCSQPSQRDSDFSPLVTRQSSSSSYAPDGSPALSGTATTQKLQALTIPKRSSPTPTTLLTESPVSAQPSLRRTNSSLIRVVSVPPNLDKPLPPSPRSYASQASLSVPDLLLRQPPAELPSEIPTSLTSRAYNAGQGTSSHPVRMLSTRRGSDGSITTHMPSWSSRSIRKARVEKAVATQHSKNRSSSDTEVPQYGRPINETSRPHTVDMQKFALALPSTSRPPQTSRKHIHRPITAATAERVIYRVMCTAHTAQDLQATAMVSKGFYRTFQRNESKLVSHLIFKSSRAAWELRRSTLDLKGSNNFLLKDYQRDCRTIDALKAFIAIHCSATCKPSTLVGLLGQDNVRMAQVDDALWRIWTFCTLFGNTVGRSGPAQTEIDWLNGTKAASNKQLGAGFAIGNEKGLTIRELEDMNEMWRCLQVLVAGFHGREQEAKRYGVFDNWHLRESSTDSQHLAEWTSYLLALGPQTILTLSGCSFDQAQILGLTTWPLPPIGQSRSSFLTSAIAHAYQERVLEDATQKAAQLSLRHMSARVAPLQARSHRPTRSLDEKHLVPNSATRMGSSQTQSLGIDTSGEKRRPVSTISANVMTNARLDIRPDCDPESARIDIRPDCDPVWRTSQASSGLPTSPTADPTVYYSLSTTATASTKLGATLFTMDYASPASRVPFPVAERTSAPVSEVVDPIDKAMNLLVRELGFAETRARKALAMCDTGSGIDLQKAIELLTIDSKHARQTMAMPVELPTPGSHGSSSGKRMLQPRRAYCDRDCKRTMTVSHSRNQSSVTTGTATDVSISPISVVDDAEWHDTVSPLALTPTPTSKKRMLNRASSKTKAWKMLGLDSAPRRKNLVLRIDEYQAQ